jgi:very-short-patch-repair endonuclease
MALLAEQQHEVVARWQLILLGFTSSQIHRLVSHGFIHRLFRGVFTVGSRQLTREGRWMAAVLACGEDAVLSHRSAIALWGLRPATAGPIDVTDPTRRHSGQPGIRVHRTRGIEADDRTERRSIPVTSVHRAILDFAEVAKEQHVRLAIEMADRKELYNSHVMDELVRRSPGRRGVKTLTAVLATMRGTEAPLTRSELERILLAEFRQAGFPEPSANVMIEGYCVDLVWIEQRVIVEVDGHEWHKTRADLESNRKRDTRLQLAGFIVIRATEIRILHELPELVGDVGIALSGGRGAARSGP